MVAQSYYFFWRVFLLLSYSFFILGLLLSNQILRYIHPDFIKWQWFSAILLFFFAFIQVASPKLKDAKLHPLVICAFLLPLVLGYLVPPVLLGADAVQRQGWSVYDTQWGSSSLYLDENLVGGSHPILISDENFVQVMHALYQQPQKYVDREVELTGFVARYPSLDFTEFLLVRLIVSCHVAHAQPDGFIVVADNAEELALNQWVHVRGYIEIDDHIGSTVLKLRAVDIQKVPPLTNPYVYLW